MKNKIYKLLSILLTLAIVLSAGTVAFASGLPAADSIYYVDNALGDDSDDGMSENTPLKTLSKAMQLAIAAGKKAGDTVYFKFMGNSAAYEAVSHDFTAVLTSNDPANRAGMQLGTLQGPTIIDNISITNWNGGTQLNSKDLTIKSTASGAFYVDTVWFRGGNTSAPQTVVFEQALNMSYLYIGQEYNDNVSFDGDVTLVIDNAESNIPTIALGIGSGNANFNGNLNFNFKDMAAVNNFVIPSGASFAKGFQIINSSDVDFATQFSSQLAGVDSSKLWVLNNTTKDYKDALEFTETPGKFIVNEGYSVVAINTADNTKIKASDADVELGSQVLDLTTMGAGIYNITVERAPGSYNYYVSASGSDATGNGTEGNAVASIQKAVELAVAAGLGARDKVTVNLTGESVTLGVMPAYEFDLTIKGIDETVTTVNSTDTYNQHFANSRVGKTTIQNISFANDAPFYLNDSKDVVLTEMSKLSGQKYLTFGNYADADQAKTVAGQNVYIGISVRFVNLANTYWQNKTYTEDVNITLDHDDAKPYFELTASNPNNVGESPKVTYKKNLNINVKNSPRIIFQSFNNGTVEGAIQIINSSAANDGDGVLFSTASKVFADINCDKYVLNNNTGIKDLISFIPGVEGKFFVKEGQAVTATKGGSSVTSAYSEEFGANVLDLTALGSGDYTIEIVTGPKKADYFVSATGSDLTGNGSEAAPVATIQKAVELAIAAGLGEDDEVTVKLTGETVTLGNIPAYDFDLNIKGIDETTTKVASTNTYIEAFANSSVGKTIIQNVTFADNAPFYLNHSKDVVLTEMGKLSGEQYLTLGTYADNDQAKTVAGQNIYIGISVRFMNLGNSYWQNITYTEDVNITLDHADAKPYFNLNPGFSNGAGESPKVTYEKNLNINAIQSPRIRFENVGNVTINGAIQVINSCGAVDKNETNVFSTNAPVFADINCDKYVLNNNTGIKDLISFIPGVEGKFFVKEGQAVTATKGGSSVTAAYSEEFDAYVLDLTTLGSGDYEIEIVTGPKKADYFVSATGSDETGNGSEAAPVATIQKAVELAIAAGLGAGDEVTVKITGDINLGTVPGYDFDLNIKGIGESASAVATTGESQYFANSRVGKTTLENITFANNGSFYLNDSKDVTLLDTVGKLSGEKYLVLGNYADNDQPKSVAGQNIYVGFPVRYIYFGNSFWHNKTYTEDLNITLDNADAKPYFCFNSGGTVNGEAPKAKYEKNVNINAIQSPRIRFETIGDVTIEGAIQIINSCGAVDASETDIFSTNSPNFVDINCDKYVLNNNTGIKDLLSFIPGVEGKFFVKEGKTVVATKGDASVTSEYNDEFDAYVLDLTALGSGDYEITTVRLPQTYEYFVSANGNDDNDGLSAGTALKTVGGVVAKANAIVDIAAMDKVVANVALGETVEWGTTEAYAYELTVQSSEALGATLSLPGGAGTCFAGTTVIKNVSVPSVDQFMFGNYSVTFDEGTSFNATYPAAGNYVAYDEVDGQRIILRNSGWNPYQFKLNADYGGNRQFTDDLYVEVDNADANIGFAINADLSCTGYDADANLNLYLRQGSAHFKPLVGDLYHDGAIQVIVGTNANFTEAQNITSLTPAKGVYILKNTTGIEDVVTFIPNTAGKFFVKEGEKVIATKGSTTVTSAYDEELGANVLDLTAAGAGEYTFKVDIQPKTYNYYVSANGDDNADGLTAGTALKTVGGVVAKANANKEIFAIDKVVVNVISGEIVSWGNVPSYKFLLVVETADISTEKATIDIPSNTRLSGDTAFYNIGIGINGSESILAYANHDVTFGEGTDCSAPRYTFFGEGATNSVESQTVIYKNAIGGYQVKIGNDWSGVNYDGDVNVVVDNPNAAPVFTLGGNYGTASTFNGNLNFEIVKASSFAINYLGGTPRINSALQILNSASGVTVSANAGDLANIDASKKYIVNNVSGATDLISYTDEVGQYAVNIKKYIDIVATNTEGKKFYPNRKGILTLPAGEYTLTCSKEPAHKTYYVEADSTNGDGSFAKPYATVTEAINAAINAGYISVDEVTVVVKNNVSWGSTSTPAHGFKLTVTSLEATRYTVTVTDNTSLGGDTTFDNVEVSARVMFFAGHDAIFTENSIFGVKYSIAGMVTGNNAIPGQRIEFNSQYSTTGFKLSNDLNGYPIYTGDVYLKVNNNDSALTIALNPNEHATTFDGNLNLNFARAAEITLTDNSGTSVINGTLQVIVNANTVMNSKEFLLAKKTDGNYWYIVDDSMQKGILDFTNEAGLYKVTEDIEVTAKHSDGTTRKSIDGVLDLRDKKGEWTITTTTYFEDFDNMTDAEFVQDFRNTLGTATLDKENGKLVIQSHESITNHFGIIENRNINAENQYISVDVKGEGFNSTEGGAQIFARINADHRESYRVFVCGGMVRVWKYNSNCELDTNTFDMEGWVLGGKPHAETNKFSYNPDHTYRVGLSVVNDENDENVAYVRAFVLDLNTNKMMFDETFKDTARYNGDGIGLATDGSTDESGQYFCRTYFDNLYVSTEGFRENDESIAIDVNYDGIYDIRDLVRVSEYIANNKAEINADFADRNIDDVINADDVSIIRRELLTDADVSVSEFALKGNTDALAEQMRENIKNTPNSTYSGSGTTYYVSATASDRNNGLSTDKPMSLKKLSNTNLSAGDIVLFKRGDVFRMATPNATTVDGVYYYGYVLAKDGVTYGAYGDGDKPLFKDSPVDLTTRFSKIGDTNIYVYEAGTLVGENAVENDAVNMIFNGGEEVGLRKQYREGLYTLYKNGHFTTDDEGNIYLYCDQDPAEVYTSIEISRATFGFMIQNLADNVVIDNIAFEGFGCGAISGLFGNDNITVTNCVIGFAGGVSDGSVRMGNAIGMWAGGSGSTISNNWIYQTFDSAISPQGNGTADYSNYTIANNLLEYNNADIEFFDNGDSSYDLSGWNITGNLMRFTTLGWGSREVDGIRGIQGVLRGNTMGASVVDINFSNNTIDSPGMEVVNFSNATSEDSIFTFDSSADATANVISNNIYYFNPHVRHSSVVMRGYKTSVEDTGTTRSATTKAQFEEVMRLIDNNSDTRYN